MVVVITNEIRTLCSYHVKRILNHLCVASGVVIFRCSLSRTESTNGIEAVRSKETATPPTDLYGPVVKEKSQKTEIRISQDVVQCRRVV